MLVADLVLEAVVWFDAAVAPRPGPDESSLSPRRSAD
jgi:hypothetical protein